MSIRHFKNTIIIFLSPLPLPLASDVLHNHCFQFLLGRFEVLGETENNGYGKLWVVGQKYCYGIFL